jgi:hypothetical protein
VLSNTKFGRTYELQVGTADGQLLTVRLPFTIEFDVTRNTLTSANVCQIRIYNLSKLNRNRLRFNITNFGGPYRPLRLRAGYGDNLAEIFSGNVSQAWSVREGTNYVTQIECYDGGFAFVNGVTDRQFAAGTPQALVIRQIMSDLPETKVGAVGAYPGVLTRGNAYSGNTAQILTQLTGGGFFIDNGSAHALQTNEYVVAPGGVVTINAKTGILNTPILEQSIVRFDMLFEPSLNVGSAAFLESITEDNFTGLYKITGVKHRGVISAAVAGRCITSGEFFYSKLLTPAAGL